MIELWDAYDQNRVKAGVMRRGDPVPPGGHRLVVHVCVFNHRGEMLIQQRQPFKDGWPNRWDLTAGGCAVAGDTSRTAAEREFLEELGVPLELGDARPGLTVNFPQGFDDYYLVEREIDPAALHLQYEEVQAVRWATREEILQMADGEDFIPYHKSLIELLFDLRGREGAHRREEDT